MMFPSQAEMWIPLVPAPEDTRTSRYLQVFGRLRDGLSRKQAQTEMNGIAARLAVRTARGVMSREDLQALGARMGKMKSDAEQGRLPK